MSNRSLGLDDRLHEYLLRVSGHEAPVLRRLREATAGHEHAGMQISPEQGRLMALLVRLMGARRAIEIGTFTGYSALSVAAALPADGKLVACDVSEAWTSVGAPFWREAGVAERIDLRIAPAADTLRSLLDAGEAGRFDFAFIDADKERYALYFEHCLALVRPGGLIAVDNTLWSGKVADPAHADPSTAAIRDFNASLAVDPRVAISVLPVGDGLTLALKLDPGSDADGADER